MKTYKEFITEASSLENFRKRDSSPEAARARKHTAWAAIIGNYKKKLIGRDTADAQLKRHGHPGVEDINEEELEEATKKKHKFDHGTIVRVHRPKDPRHGKIGKVIDQGIFPGNEPGYIIKAHDGYETEHLEKHLKLA